MGAPIWGSQVLLEKQGDTFTAAYTHGNALLRRNSEYPLYDGHGSERTVTNGSETATGTINFEVHTDPYRTFGQTAGTTGSSSSPYMYAGAWGYRTDGDAGLMHVGARYYDAQVGRPGFARVHAEFITRDTVLSEHPYLYCEHDAVNWVDPSGYGKWAVIGSVCGAIGGGVIGFIVGGGPPGAVVGARIGASVGSFAGSYWGDGSSLGWSIGAGVVGYVGGGGIGTGVGRTGAYLFPRPVVEPIARNWVYRMGINGVVRRHL